MRGLLLGYIALDIGGLLDEVEEEPKLDARVRNSQVDLVTASQLDRLVESRVLIDIKDAPHLIVRPTATSPSILLVYRLGVGCLLNQRHWSSTKLVDLNVDLIAKSAVPKPQVLLLRYRSLYEDQQLSSVRPRRDRSARAGHYSSVPPAGSAICSSTRRETMGTPP